jgi:hypothetical protein
VRNGGFETGNFSDWTAEGLLYKAVVPAAGWDGKTNLVARLGTQDYGPSLQDPGEVPVGDARVWQAVDMPTLRDVARPTLSFRYRVFSYDVMYSERLQRFVDTFEVWAYDANGQPLAMLLRGGNPTATYGELYDTGWKWALIDLTPYAGQTIQLVFINFNRHDNLFNTWSLLDDVRVQDWPYSYRNYLSEVFGGAGAAATAQGAATPDASAPAPDAVSPEITPDAKR